MKFKIKKKWLKISLWVISALLIIILIGPLFVPVKQPETGLSNAKDLKSEYGNFVNVPFEGTDGINTYYDYIPSNQNPDKNFILLHGSLYSTKTWNEILKDLSKYGNVYAYDQIPYGLSEKLLEGDWSKDNPYTIDSAIIQLENFMEKLNIESATLIGSSYGSVIAAEAAIKFPEKVEDLILVDPAILVSETVPSFIMESPQAERVGPYIGRYLAKDDGFYNSTYYDEEKLNDERMELNKLLTKVNDWDIAFWEYLQAWGTKASDVGERLDKINKKTLVISGEFDKIVPVKDSEKIAKTIPNATFEIVENT